MGNYDTPKIPLTNNGHSLIHSPNGFGERLADKVVAFMGSWRFIILQTCVVCIWVVSNRLSLIKPFDPFPFILLNLLFSTQAAYSSPLILMSSNRIYQKDKKRDDIEALEVGEMSDIQHAQLGLLEHLNELQENQMEILAVLRETLQIIKDHVNGGEDLRITESVTSQEMDHDT